MNTYTAAVDPLPAGIHVVPEMQYHADPCAEPSLSNSVAKVLLNLSPRHAWAVHPRLNPQRVVEQKAEFDFGTAAHALLLEGRDICTVVDAPDWRAKAAQTARAEAYGAGRVPLLPPQHASLGAMVAAARIFMREARLPAMEAGVAEQTLIWQDGDRGSAWCRGRLDWLSGDRELILDYKTTNAAGRNKWMRSMIEFGYDTQSAFYRRGLRRLGARRPQFQFLVQEAFAPYCCYLVDLAESMRHLAELKVERAVNIWGRCMQTGEWPAYGTLVHEAEAPAWALAEEGISRDEAFEAESP